MSFLYSSPGRPAYCAAPRPTRPRPVRVSIGCLIGSIRFWLADRAMRSTSSLTAGTPGENCCWPAVITGGPTSGKSGFVAAPCGLKAPHGSAAAPADGAACGLNAAQGSSAITAPCQFARQANGWACRWAVCVPPQATQPLPEPEALVRSLQPVRQERGRLPNLLRPGRIDCSIQVQGYSYLG